ncbi:MAG: efflux RND transporter permease subunit [Nitrosomonadales bacterium]|jgi:multidrug efflux pump subunit AcrB|nr:efflux RND transporter permease subunit [Nitrosomonadales bacterium]
MNISELAFKYKKIFIFIVLSLMIYGGISYFTLPSQEDPTITNREAIVTTNYPGMSPQRIELLITKKLEENIRKIPEIKMITSISQTGSSIIHVKIEDKYFDLPAIWQNLRNKVKEAEKELPEGTSTPNVNDEFGDVAVITMALTSDGFGMSDMHDMAKHIRDILYGVKGTKKIDLFGIQEERIYLKIESTKLAEIGVTPSQIATALQTQNIILPGGQVDTGARSFVLEPTGDYKDIEELGDTLISVTKSGYKTNKDTVITLRDIATIERGYVDPPNKTAYFNGKPAIVFGISMLEGYNLLEFSPRVLKVISEIQETMPFGYTLDIATYQAEVVDATISGVSINVLQTLIIVLFSVIIFLGFRTGFIVGSIVPTVMLITLALMNFYNLELERMSLATLIIALGLLVDNGIVVAEDFMQRLEKGVSRIAALKGVGKELTIPLLTSSLTTILFFMPLMMAESAAGEYTRSLSLVIAMALLTSWIAGLCLTPILCYYFVKIDKKKSQEKESSGIFYKLSSGYGLLLKGILKIRFIFLGMMFATFVFSIIASKEVPKRFFPDSDRPQILVYTQLPAGASQREMTDQMKKVFVSLDDRQLFPNIESYSGYVGFGGPRFVLSLAPEDAADNMGFIIINIDDIEKQDSSIGNLESILNDRFPGMFFRVKKMFLGSSDSTEIKLQVVGPDADIIYDKAQQLVDRLYEIPDATDIRTDWQNRTLKILIKVDQVRARRAGVSSTDIAQSLNAYFEGTEITQFREEDNIIPILFRAEDEERFNLDRMRTLNVYSSSKNTNVPLLQIADFEGQNQYSRIARKDLFRTVSVEVRNVNMTAQDFKEVLDPIVDELNEGLPANHLIKYDGVIRESKEAQESLSASVPLVIGLIIILLVAQFNSFRRPLIILITIPLSFIGAVLGLLVSGSNFGFMGTLGLYSLAGIIINNAIILIDRIDLEREMGKKIYDAIISACQQRLRPIIITTLTTTLGLLTLIIPHDPLFYGLANIIAYGLGVGTFLTLAVVPVLYSILFKDKAAHGK